MKMRLSTSLAVSCLLLVMKLFWGRSLQIDKKVHPEHLVITIKVKHGKFEHSLLADLILPLVKSKYLDLKG